MRQIKKLTWLQAYVLEDVRVIWCDSLGVCLFQILCDEFCRLCVWFLFTYHLTCISNCCFLHTLHKLLFAKLCTCYCVCFWFDQPSLKIPWVLCKTYLMLENLREWIENLDVGKTGFKTCVFEKHFISYSCILFIKFNALRSFCKNLFFLEFRSIEPIFRSIEIVIKNFGQPLSVLIDA